MEPSRRFNPRLTKFESGARPAADWIFFNGPVYTADDEFRIAEAVAVAGDRILCVGTQQEVQQFRSRETRVVDLRGRPVVPGFIDAHYHFLGVGKRFFILDLRQAKSLAQCLALVRREARRRPAGEWIIGGGWHEENWPEKRVPRLEELDAAAPDHPVFLKRADGHAALVNSSAMQRCGIDAGTADPDGGRISRDISTARPTGLLVDRAMELVLPHLPADRTAETRRKYALQANRVAASHGITEIHDMGVTWEVLEVYRRLFHKGELDVRIHAYVRGPGEEAERLFEEGPSIGEFDHHLTVRGVKILLDGALGSRGAALLRPYSDAAGRGLFLHSEEELLPLIQRALQTGIQMAIHAIGDAANHKVLDLYEKAFSAIPAERRAIAQPRFRIEHAQLVAEKDFSRFAALGIFPSMQPSHAISDLHFAGRRLGWNRLRRAYAWRRFLELVCKIAAGSDAPVEAGNPMIEFYAATVRRDLQGFSGRGWHRELRMTRREALLALTRWAATAVFEENIKGSLEAGKLADLVILSDDLLTAADEKLPGIRPHLTMIGGSVVYHDSSALD